MINNRRIRIHYILSSDLTIPLLLAIIQFALQVTFHANYNYFRDELYYIACSDHLAFGYVDQPPFSIGILWINRLMFGDSLHALRFLPAVVGAVVVLMAALMARKLGGTRSAQALAALSVVSAHGLIGHGKFFSMNPFDVFFWTLAEYFVLVLLLENRPKLWVPFGIVIGLGLSNKYSIGFMVIGLVAGLLLTRQRKQLFSGWFWIGAGIATLLFLPHIVWQVANNFSSVEFMRNAAANKNISVGPLGFLMGQIRDMNILNVPLWVSGIYFFFRHHEGRCRPLGSMFIVVFLVMVVGNAKIYYLSAIYPLFLAGGAVFLEQTIRTRALLWLRSAYPVLLALLAILILPFALPVLPVEKFIQYEHFLGILPRADERNAVAQLPQYYADQFGWEEMVDSVAIVYGRLTPEEQARCVVFVRNYGEAAAIDFYGRTRGLPNARCAHNSYWMWGPGERTGDIAIVFGNSRNLNENFADLRRRWKHVELAATTNAQYAMPFENGRMIFLCKGMNTTFQDLWPSERVFI